MKKAIQYYTLAFVAGSVGIVVPALGSAKEIAKPTDAQIAFFEKQWQPHKTVERSQANRQLERLIELFFVANAAQRSAILTVAKAIVSNRTRK